MFSTTDTIVAIATPPGFGGLGVVRISGSDASRIAATLTSAPQPLTPRHATLATVRGADGLADQAVLTYFAAPHSYTGEDVVEISAHGSPVLLRGIVAASMQAGARLAEPGEFTLRAYLNGRIDLVQAEAVADLVSSVTPLQARSAFDQLEGTLTGIIRSIDAALFDLIARLEASLDFPAEGYHFVEGAAAGSEVATLIDQLSELLTSAARGRLVREGVQVVITGRTNTGKSSIFNNLCGASRAIVTAVPGTTRDLLTEVADIEGLPVTLVDTAGVRAAPADAVEAEGIMRGAAARQVASVVVLVLDASTPLTSEDYRLLEETNRTPRVVVANKNDLPGAWQPDTVAAQVVSCSALSGEGLRAVRRAILDAAGHTEARDLPAVTNLRHANLLGRARDALRRAQQAASDQAPEEFVLADLNEARRLLEEVTGARTQDDVLAHIFSRFCIGK